MFWKNKRIYFDYAAATPQCSSSYRAYRRALHAFGNPSAIHKDGVAAKRTLEDARKSIASFLGCRARNIFFTSGGTESNNLAIIGFASALEKKGTELSKTHWIVSVIEHPSVLECFRALEGRGATVTYLAPSKKGEIRTSDLLVSLRKNTVFVSIGWVNGEIGVVQSIHALAQAIREHERKYNSHITFHTDAGQAPLYIPTTIDRLGVDLLTLDGGKCYGPKGIGVMYKNNDVELAPLFWGGGQEGGLRPGSEAHALAAGFASALAWIKKVREKESERLWKLRSFFISEIQNQLPKAVLNGDAKKTLPHIVNISLPYISSEYVVLALDQKGIALSTKSSCREGEEESHVVGALGVDSWRAKNTLRVSFGSGTKKHEIQSFVQTLKDVARTFE